MNATIEKTATQIILKTSYNREFVDALKSEIPYTERKWDSYHKVWGVSLDYAERAEKIFNCFFGTEDALDAEIEQIQANQAYILKSQTSIEEIINALDTAISGYSYRSKSSIKGRMCRDRALLQHSLRNAEIPVERLVELQVRGLAAAVKLLKTESIRTLTRR